MTLPQKAVRNGRFIGRDVVKSRRAVSVEYNFQDGGNEREREREARHIDRTIGNGYWTCLFLIVVFANVDSMYRKRRLQ